MVISIVINSDGGHCYKHLKKNYDENWTSDMYLNVCVYNDFWEMKFGKMEKWNFGLFRPNLCELGLFHPVFCM